MLKITSFINALVALTKPSITLLVLITGMTGLIVEGSTLHSPELFILALVLLALASGAANGLNQFLERDRDSMMVRTKKRRPLPMGRLSPTIALIFTVIIGISSVIGFWSLFNVLSAMLTLGTILFYSLFYTLYLKPRTPQNIVIGGAAGAMGPVITWAASSGTLSLEPILMFLIIFLWTPPHFWALALVYKDDYEKIGYPMMPLVVGNAKTVRMMVIYTVWTLLVSLVLAFFGAGFVYMLAAVVLGILFWTHVIRLRNNFSMPQAGKVFGVSIVYLLGLFVAIMVDKGVVWIVNTL